MVRVLVVAMRGVWMAGCFVPTDERFDAGFG